MDRPNDVLNDAVQQIEDLESQRADLAEDIKALIDGLAQQGFTRKRLRTLLARRKRERDDVLADDEAIEAMEAALGMKVR